MGWKKQVLILSVALAVVAADHLTKRIAQARLARAVEKVAPPPCEKDGPIAQRTLYVGGPRFAYQVVPNVFAFRYVENCGGAWGLMERADESLRKPFFMGVSIFAIVFIVWIMRRIGPSQPLLVWALPFVLGGAIGNFVDRILFRYVVDFIDVYIGTYRWPTFNVADIAICVGVGLMILDMSPWHGRRSAGTAGPDRTEQPVQGSLGGDPRGL